MFLLIFESIGTSELILIGIIALMFLGPRKLPQIAKTIGKTLNDFRSTTNEFKATWQREVNFEEEEKALRLGDLFEDEEKPAERVNSIVDTDNAEPPNTEDVETPEIRQIDKESFEAAAKQGQAAAGASVPEPDDLSDKRKWL